MLRLIHQLRSTALVGVLALVLAACGQSNPTAAVEPTTVAERTDAAPSTAPAASGEALRHVLVGGTPSVQAFSSEVAEAEGGDAIPAHTATKIIGEVLAEIDAHEG